MDLAHSRHGQGPPLVLVHGLGGSKRIWEPCLEFLEAERDVICLDMPGFGESEPLEDGTAATPGAFASAIAAFCGRLGIERPVVAGNSLGGWAALEMARQGSAAAVVGLSPAGLWRRPLGPRAFDGRRVAKLVAPLLRRWVRSEDGRRRLFASIAARPEAIPPDTAEAILHDWISAPGYEVANHWMRKLRFEDPAEVTVPVTIGWGTEERLLRRPRPERLPPGTRFELLHGCGHTPTWDDPAAVSRLLLEGSSLTAPGEGP